MQWHTTLIQTSTEAIHLELKNVKEILKKNKKTSEYVTSILE